MTDIIPRQFPVDPSGILPAVTPDNEAHWSALAEGRLLIQRCQKCTKARYPIAPVCPYCGDNTWTWNAVSGQGRIFSWVRYHRSYLPEFEDLMPYVVATIELDEGPRLFGRLVGKVSEPKIGQAVGMVVERWPDGRCVPAFATVEKGK